MANVTESIAGHLRGGIEQNLESLRHPVKRTSYNSRVEYCPDTENTARAYQDKISFQIGPLLRRIDPQTEIGKEVHDILTNSIHPGFQRIVNQMKYGDDGLQRYDFLNRTDWQFFAAELEDLLPHAQRVEKLVGQYCSGSGESETVNQLVSEIEACLPYGQRLDVISG